MVISRWEGNDYSFVDGALSYHEEDISLRCFLEPGKYIFFAKLDPTRRNKTIPENASVSIYSQDFAKLKVVDQKTHPNFLKKSFLDHARQHKRQSYNNDLMWISWKLLYQQGGYAYVALGNDHQSNKKFVINFNERYFAINSVILIK